MVGGDGLAAVIYQNHMITGVAHGGFCASACVEVWASGTTKTVPTDGGVAVHRATHGPKGDTDAENATTYAVRVYQRLGAPKQRRDRRYLRHPERRHPLPHPRRVRGMERQDHPLRKDRDHKSADNARRLTQTRKTEVRPLRLASCDGLMAIKVRDDVAAKMTPAQIRTGAAAASESLIRRRTADLELIAVMVEHPALPRKSSTQVSRAGASTRLSKPENFDALMGNNGTVPYGNKEPRMTRGLQSRMMVAIPTSSRPSDPLGIGVADGKVGAVCLLLG